MQDTYSHHKRLQPNQDAYNLSKYRMAENEYFSSNPECPNHKDGVPFSSAFANPNSDGHVSCANCFLHSTIIESMALSCHHLHACSTCPHCYASSANKISPPGATGSPPIFSCNTPPETGASPPLFHQTSLQGPFSPQFAPNSQLPTQDINSRQSFRTGSIPFTALQYNEGSAVMRSPYLNPPDRAPIPHSYVGYNPTTEQKKNFCNNSPSNISSPVSPSASSVSDSLSSYDVTKKSGLQQSTRIVKMEITHNRKRGANDVCEVCGDRASGYHYNALTCEGCKGFFRRTINRKEPLFSCKFGGNCEMDTYTRRKCPECRLKKCKAVGMLEECLLTEIQCQSKRRNRGTKKNRSTDSQATVRRSSSVIDAKANGKNEMYDEKPTEDDELSDEDKKKIQYITTAFKNYAFHPELVNGWDTYLDGKPVSLCELATCHVRILVEFSKNLPGFDKLKPEDQIGLLKGSVVEIMLLRNSQSYNSKKGDIDVSIVAKDTGLQEARFRCMLDFFNKVDKLNLNETEYALLSSIILFDCDHACSKDASRIDQYRENYIMLLKRYSENKKPKRKQILAKILNVITELRTLYSTHAQMVSNYRKRGELSPLLREIWDL